MSAAPFHMWTPDVYEGAPTPVTAFFASSVKVAAVAIMARIVLTAFPGVIDQWRQIVIFLAVVSTLLGSFAAIGQANIKRLMAYSSIGHMGFVLIGLAAGTEDAIRGVAIYLVIYAIMTLGAFAAILTMRVDGKPVEKISDLAGLSHSNGAMAFFFSMLMFSLAGVPPLGGFFAKYYVLLPAVQAGLYPLAVIGVLASAVAAYYYLRDRQGHVFRRAGSGFRPFRLHAARSAGGFVDLFAVLLGLSGAADERGDSRREIAVLKADGCLELGCEARARGVRLLSLEEVDSTNDEGKRLVAEGERGPLWIVAGRQTRGRGRLGRQWVSTPGNLHASLVLSGGSLPSLAPQLGFVAGVALIDAVRRTSGLGGRLALKWPNDLLLDGGKLAGVLLEGVPIATGDPRAPHECVVVIGIGVNCASAPRGLPYPARALSEAGSGAPTAERVVRSADRRLCRRAGPLGGGDGFPAIREKWLEFGGGPRPAGSRPAGAGRGSAWTLPDDRCPRTNGRRDGRGRTRAWTRATCFWLMTSPMFSNSQVCVHDD